MASPLTGPMTPVVAHNLLNSWSVVVLAAKLLRAHWEQLPDQDRVDVLDRLGHHAEYVAASLKLLVQTGEEHIGRLPAPPSETHSARVQSRDQERIAELETAAAVTRDRIEALEAAALDSEAAALVSDARILELAADVERLLAVRDHATVIDEAKAVLMSMMHIGEDAAFAVLVAASQREDVDLYTIAERIAVPQDESSNN